MFGRVGRFAVHHPWATIVSWVVVAVAVIGLAPSMPSASDQAEFLPDHYESIQAAELQERAFPQQQKSPAAIAVFQREDGASLTDGDMAEVAAVAADLQSNGYDDIEQIVTAPEMVSPSGTMMLATIVAEPLDIYDQDVLDAVGEIRSDAADLLAGSPLQVGITGDAATALDSQESAGDTDAMIMMATLVLIVVLLLVIFRSPLIAVLPVLMITLVFMIANGLIATAADVAGLVADASISSILIVVLFGVGTDYILFLLFRYREHLRRGEEPRAALADSVGQVGETIASAAGAVIVAFLALLLSTLGMLRAMGPSLAIAVAVALAAALTLVPAVFSLLGTKAFWPSKAWQREPRHLVAGRIGALTARRPAFVAGVSGLALAGLAAGIFGFNAEFDSTSSLPDDLESVRAMDDLQQEFSAGTTDPTPVYLENTVGGALDESTLADFGAALAGVGGVAQVMPPELSPDGSVARFSVALDYRPAEQAAIDLVSGELRDVAAGAAPDDAEALVGGTTAVLADIQSAVSRDYSVVFPAAGIAIMVILGLLLRSVVAPLYLMVAVGLGFTATLGSTVLLFQNIQGETGLLFTLPIIVYLFVVAIGTDYNILMVARLREETRRGHGPREAARLAVSRSAPTIAAAAVILAGTFGVLVLADNSMLKQMGFAVAFGILLTGFVMAILLVPAITAMLRHAAWWPGHQDAPDSRSPVGTEEPEPVLTEAG